MNKRTAATRWMRSGRRRRVRLPGVATTSSGPLTLARPASTSTRALREALDHLAAGRADALIVARLDRLARSVAHAADILDLARRQGWNLIIADLGLDLSTPQGRALAQTMAVFAELERELISQRTREGLAAARAKGKRIGRPRLAPSAVVDRICSERKAGASFGSIARALTADEVLTPAGRTTWQSSTVRRIYAAATRQEVA